MTTKHYYFEHIEDDKPEMTASQVVDRGICVAMSIISGDFLADLSETTDFIGKAEQVKKELNELKQESAENSGDMCYYTREGHYMNLATIEAFWYNWQDAMERQKKGLKVLFHAW